MCVIKLNELHKFINIYRLSTKCVVSAVVSAQHSLSGAGQFEPGIVFVRIPEAVGNLRI